MGGWTREASDSQLKGFEEVPRMKERHALLCGDGLKWRDSEVCASAQRPFGGLAARSLDTQPMLLSGQDCSVFGLTIGEYQRDVESMFDGLSLHLQVWLQAQRTKSIHKACVL